MPKDTDCAWAAGIVDGEGTVTTVTRSPSIRVQVPNTDPRMVFKLKEIFGGSVRFQKEKRANRRDVYIWSVSAVKALVFLEHIQPYLIVKRDQADLCIALQKRISIRAGYVASKGYGASIMESEKVVRNDLRNEIAEFNKRGRHAQRF